jgi:hypothetical protein
MLVKPSLDAFTGIEFDTLYQPAWDEALVGGDFYDAFLSTEDASPLWSAMCPARGLEAAAYTAELKYYAANLFTRGDRTAIVPSPV